MYGIWRKKGFESELPLKLSEQLYTTFLSQALIICKLNTTAIIITCRKIIYYNEFGLENAHKLEKYMQSHSLITAPNLNPLTLKMCTHQTPN